tara:strand:+ start:318 stop:710 length:393 start_codon:yes stop_codon:yes gene_type:complete
MDNNISKKQLREFGYLIGIGFPLIIGWLIPAISGHVFRTWTLFFSIPILIIGILRPALLSELYKLWMKLGYLLGWVNSRIILGLIFILILQPISLFMKLFNYDPLRKKRNNNMSYRESNENHKIDYKKIF